MDLSCLSFTQQCTQHSSSCSELDSRGFRSATSNPSSGQKLLLNIKNGRSPWSNLLGFEALPISRIDVGTCVVYRMKDVDGHLIQMSWSLCFFFFLNATEGIIADWLQFYHLVISNLYFYFGVSINTLERRGRSMAAEGRNSSAAAAVSTRSLKTAANQTSSPSFSTDSTFIKHS